MSTITNVAPKKIVSPSSPTDGVHVVLNVFKFDNVPGVDFFASKHAFAAYKTPPTLQLTTSICSDGHDFGFAVSIESVEKFAKSVEHLCKKINENSDFEYDDRQNTVVRTLNDEAEEARDALQEAFGAFIESDDFIDTDVEVVDCEDFWTLETLKALYEPGMSDEQFAEAILKAQTEAEKEDFRILGDPSYLIDEALGELQQA